MDPSTCNCLLELFNPSLVKLFDICKVGVRICLRDSEVCCVEDRSKLGMKFQNWFDVLGQLEPHDPAKLYRQCVSISRALVLFITFHCFKELNSPILLNERNNFLYGVVNIPELEIHTIAQGLLYPGRKQADYEKSVYELLVCAFKFPEMSFLTLRYLVRCLSSSQANIFAFTYYSKRFTNSLTKLINTLREFVEWENIDELISMVFGEDIWGFGSFTRPELIEWTWSEVVRSLLKNADKFPLSIAHLTMQTNTDFGLAMGNLRSLAIYPSLILYSARDTRCEECDNDALDHVPQALQQPVLNELRKNLRSPPDILLCKVLRERESSTQGNVFQDIDRVGNDAQIRHCCRKLMEYIVSTDATLRLKATQLMRTIANLDRYCLRIIGGVLSEVPERLRKKVGVISAQPQTDKYISRRGLDDSDKEPLRPWAYRHRSTDSGRVHIRLTPPISRRHPCETCLALGIWDDWLQSPNTTCEALIVHDDQLLWLYVDRDASFDSISHLPVLAGVNDQGEQEYIASAGVERRGCFWPAYSRSICCTVRNGATVVEYEGEGQIHKTQYFRVLVLRYDQEDGNTDDMFTPGTDATGPIYWREAWIDDADEG